MNYFFYGIFQATMVNTLLPESNGEPPTFA